MFSNSLFCVSSALRSGWAKIMATCGADQSMCTQRSFLHRWRFIRGFPDQPRHVPERWEETCGGGRGEGERAFGLRVNGQMARTSSSSLAHGATEASSRKPRISFPVIDIAVTWHLRHPQSRRQRAAGGRCLWGDVTTPDTLHHRRNVILEHLTLWPRLPAAELWFRQTVVAIQLWVSQPHLAPQRAGIRLHGGRRLGGLYGLQPDELQQDRRARETQDVHKWLQKRDFSPQLATLWSIR